MDENTNRLGPGALKIKHDAEPDIVLSIWIKDGRVDATLLGGDYLRRFSTPRVNDMEDKDAMAQIIIDLVNAWVRIEDEI